jgi:hypothetical protein
MMDIQRIMQILDASSATRRIIDRSLHEIDRRALNAMVLVKRHGNKLASYGVVAQAFRDQAVHLRDSAAPLQQTVAPLVRVQLRVLQHARLAEVFRRTAGILKAKGLSGDFLSQPEVKWQRNASADEAEGTTILQRLIETVVRLQEGITEQEYVVTNGRIEAALSEQSGAPLMRVSQEMGLAVAKVKDAIWRYRAELEEILHESSVRI